MKKFVPHGQRAIAFGFDDATREAAALVPFNVT
jgi:hypothetical protein